MAAFFSDQVTKLNTVPRVAVQTNEFGGRERVAHWTYKTPAAGAPAVGDTIDLVVLPKGARVLSIYANWEAMSSGAGTAGADFGDVGDPDRYIAALNMDAAGNGFQALRLDTAVPPALGYGYEQTAETIVQAKVTGEAFAVAKIFRGHVTYVND